MSDEPDDNVGYGKPPKKSQFKKGVSGCPDGGHAQRRAKKAAKAKAVKQEIEQTDKQIADIVRKLAREKLQVRTSAGLQEMTRLEATVRRALDGVFQQDSNDRQMRGALALYKHAKMLDPEPVQKDRTMVLVVNRIQSPEEWAKSTEGELLPKNPLEGIPGAENALNGPTRRPRRTGCDDDE